MARRSKDRRLEERRPHATDIVGTCDMSDRNGVNLPQDNIVHDSLPLLEETNKPAKLVTNAGHRVLHQAESHQAVAAARISHLENAGGRPCCRRRHRSCRGNSNKYTTATQKATAIGNMVPAPAIQLSVFQNIEIKNTMMKTVPNIRNTNNTGCRLVMWNAPA